MAILVWDFDNTLAFRDGMWTNSLYNVLRYNGHELITEEDIRPYFQEGFPWHRHTEPHATYFNGLTWWEYVNTIVYNALLELEIIECEAKELTKQFRTEYLNINQWHLFHDTIKNLEESVRRGCTNYILSNHVPELIEIVEGLGIEKYFQKVISSAMIGYEKPHRVIFQELSKHIGNDLPIYMIGDNYEADIQGALNCGYEGILVRNENKMNYVNYSLDLNGIWKYIHK